MNRLTEKGFQMNFAAYGPIWRAQIALIRHHPRGLTSWWVKACLALVALLFVLAGFVFGADKAAIGIGFAILVTGSLYWAGYLATLASTTGGSLGHLTPGLLDAQIALTSMLLLGLCGFSGVLAGATFGAAACLWAIIFVCSWSCIVIMPPMNLLFFIFVICQHYVWKALDPAWRAVLSGPWGYVLAATIACASALLLFPALIRRRRLENGYAVDKARSASETFVAGSASGAGRHWIYNWFLRRAISRRDSKALALLAIGPAGHWANILIVGAISTVIAVFMVFNIDWPQKDIDATGVGIVVQLACASMLFILAFQVQAILSSMYARTGEQALLRLAPNTPPPECINRTLARALLQRISAAWLSVLGLALLFGLVTGASTEALIRACGLACMSLLLLPTVLRNYATLHRPQDFMVGTPLVLLLGVTISVIAFLPDVAMVVVPVSVLIALQLCARRLAAASKAAPMFPAGSGI
jgi:hypothetical protein